MIQWVFASFVDNCPCLFFVSCHIITFVTCHIDVEKLSPKKCFQWLTLCSTMSVSLNFCGLLSLASIWRCFVVLRLSLSYHQASWKICFCFFFSVFVCFRWTFLWIVVLTLFGFPIFCNVFNANELPEPEKHRVSNIVSFESLLQKANTLKKDWKL